MEGSTGSKKSGFKARIHGRVQGVGFRYNARKQAKRRSLSGWVRNEPDGTVTVVCEGDAEEVESFADWLKKGPPGARVSHVDFKQTPYQGVYSGFTVEF